jgi:hypothetical protein
MRGLDALAARQAGYSAGQQRLTRSASPNQAHQPRERYGYRRLNCVNLLTSSISSVVMLGRMVGV